MATIDKILEATTSFYDELRADEHGRFKSWEYCYKTFADARKNNNPNLDLLSLNLAFYLASWGMYRGSSFLLQKDYRIHIPAIAFILKKEYDVLFGIKCSDLKKEENLSLLKNLYGKLTAYYKEIRSEVAETEVFKDISETLITKILMGTLGCVPAYDRYFKSGLSLEGVGIQKYGNNSLIKVCEFYEKYNEELEVVRLNMNVAGLEYPQLKILDMGFWKIGFDADLSKGHSKSH